MGQCCRFLFETYAIWSRISEVQCSVKENLSNFWYKTSFLYKFEIEYIVVTWLRVCPYVMTI